MAIPLLEPHMEFNRVTIPVNGRHAENSDFRMLIKLSSDGRAERQ